MRFLRTGGIGMLRMMGGFPNPTAEHNHGNQFAQSRMGNAAAVSLASPTGTKNPSAVATSGAADGLRRLIANARTTW
jgi:hypothetical protein